MGAIIAAELHKLRTLPMSWVALAGTALVGVVIAVALTAQAADGPSLSPVTVALAAVPYLQCGVLLVGLVSTTHEYAGRQITTTLTAAPRRSRLIVAKTVAALVAVIVATGASLVMSLLAAAVTARLMDVATVPPSDRDLLVGAAGYLVLIGMLAHLVGLWLRHLIPALIVMLALVIVVGPVVAQLTEHARWLPDRAARELYVPGDAVLDAGTGTAVALAWMMAIGAVGWFLFVRRDP